MANKKYDKEEGVWRTIGGRRVFIKTGQSLSQAMKESGKFKKKEEQLNQEELNNLKHPKGLKTYDSVEDRYNKDKDFRSMLKKIDDDYNDDKLMSRKEYESYASRIPNREDYAATSYEDYIEATKNTGSIKEVNDSIKAYDGYMGEKEGLEEYNKVDKEWQDLAKKMEKDYDEYGGNTVEDMKRLNELSRKRDYLSIYNYNEENKKLFDKYDKEEISHKEYNEKSDKLKEKYLSTHEKVDKEIKRIGSNPDTYSSDAREDIKNNIKGIENTKKKLSDLGYNAKGGEEVTFIDKKTGKEKTVKVSGFGVNGEIYYLNNPDDFVVQDIDIKDVVSKSSVSNNAIREEYLKYMREHPNSVMDIDTFKKHIDWYRKRK